MRVKMRFRPSVLTSWGSREFIEGDYDGNVLWWETPVGKRGLHLLTRTEIEQVAEVLDQPARPVQREGKRA